MTPEQIDLARVLVTHPRFRWAAPMAAEDGDRVWPGRDEHPDGGWRRDGTILHDLTDAATAGSLLALLPAADPGAGWGVSCGPDVGWRATSCDHDLPGATCGEAVALALLVVWGAP